MASIRALRQDDDTATFACGNDDLDRFLRKYALKNQDLLHVGTTYVYEEGGRILAFATVAPATLQGDAFPATRAKRFPRYPLPALRLGRLAVDRAFQGKGVATSLLRYVFSLALEASRRLGCVGLLVDAKPSAVAFYARFGFEPATAVEGETAGHPRAIPMFLPIDLVRRS
jgi:GNAT superfamily N-acetyltransferase